MSTNAPIRAVTRIPLVSPGHLSDTDLLARLSLLAGRERDAMAELIAHLGELDARPSAYAALGFGSLFGYCTQALRFSEDSACARIAVAQTCRRFPMILDHLASGAMSLSAVRLLGPHLTAENHVSVLERAVGRTRRETEVLIAHLAPRPDAPAVLRRLPSRAPTPTAQAIPTIGPSTSTIARASSMTPAPTRAPGAQEAVACQRPVVQPTAPERYRLQCTIGEATHERLRRLQALLRREIPDGDPAAIIDRALALLLGEVEKAKLGKTESERSARFIRPGTDRDVRTPVVPARHVPRAVKRAVWTRDRGQCAYTSLDGRVCTETVFLEFHHVRPYANDGPTTIENLSLRCRRHNQYEAEVVFGRRGREVKVTGANGTADAKTITEASPPRRSRASAGRAEGVSARTTGRNPGGPARPSPG